VLSFSAIAPRAQKYVDFYIIWSAATEIGLKSKACVWCNLLHRGRFKARRKKDILRVLWEPITSEEDKDFKLTWNLKFTALISCDKSRVSLKAICGPVDTVATYKGCREEVANASSICQSHFIDLPVVSDIICQPHFVVRMCVYLCA
jgi:hypothetical protein